LPPFLIPADKGGLNNGFMIAQYTAAALLAENKVLAHPASVDSIPTSANQEDHVSFGMTSAVKAKEIVENVEQILAIELMCATQALDFKKPIEAGRGSAVAQKVVREVVPFYDRDRVLYRDLEKIVKVTSAVVAEVEKAIGLLKI
jgi:histidine ammonia-lyase